jgi:hypothetical protein
VTGRRLPDGEIAHMDPGDYQRDEHGGWWVCLPNGDASNITTWTVTEHDDRTITVSPSIHSIGRWHGFLERGVWREC